MSTPSSKPLTPSASESPTPNSCGECNVCCILPKVSAIDKPANQPCRYLQRGENGCTVYARRPMCCQKYACLWLQGFLSEDIRLRPDQLGVLFELHPTPHGAIYVFREVRAGTLIQDGALLNPEDPFPIKPFLIIDAEGTGYLTMPDDTTTEEEQQARQAIQYLESIA